MPSKIDIVTRNRTVYAGASPPTVDVGMFAIAKTGVDLKNAGTTTVFTVPTSRVFVLTGCGTFVTAVTSGGAGVTSFQIKESGGSNSMSPSYSNSSNTPVVNQTVQSYAADINSSAARSSCASGNNVQFVLATSNAGSTAVTGTVFVIGFYVT